MSTQTKRLCIGHSNIQGGLTGLAKPLQVQHLMSDHQLDICSINETNLKSDIATSTLFLPHFAFEFYRCDRSNDKGQGGCGLLVNKKLDHIKVEFEKRDCIEAVWIALKILKFTSVASIDQLIFALLMNFLIIWLTAWINLMVKK